MTYRLCDKNENSQVHLDRECDRRGFVYVGLKVDRQQPHIEFYDALGQLTVQITIIKCCINLFAPFIGVGHSESTPDGITVVQRSVDVEIAAALVQGLKTSWNGHRFSKFISVLRPGERFKKLVFNARQVE